MFEAATSLPFKICECSVNSEKGFFWICNKQNRILVKEAQTHVIIEVLAVTKVTKRAAGNA